MGSSTTQAPAPNTPTQHRHTHSHTKTACAPEAKQRDGKACDALLRSHLARRLDAARKEGERKTKPLDELKKERRLRKEKECGRVLMNEMLPV